MSNQLRDPNGNDASDGDSRGPVFTKTFDHTYSNDNLLLGSRDTAVELATLHPEPVHIFRLWQVYLDNANPLLKVTHTPTLQGRIIEAAGNVRNISPNLEALMFSIYCMATLSLGADECEARFGLPKDDLLVKYQFGCQQALLNSGFLRTNNRDCLTALYLYLASLWATL